MALIKCSECGKEISDKASTCPHCGCPVDISIVETTSETEFAENDLVVPESEGSKVKEKKEKHERKPIKPLPIIIGILVIIVACVLAWLLGVKIPRDKAYVAYTEAVTACNSSVDAYNTAVNAYNDLAKEVVAANDSFDKVVNAAQACIDCGEVPYEGAKITNLSNSIKDARNNKVPTPELYLVSESYTIDETLAEASKEEINATTASMTTNVDSLVAKIEGINSEKESLSVPDYTSFVEKIQSGQKELEDSYAIQKQITCPTEEWVITRLGQVENIANIAPVTEENDPNGNLNKAGGYTATVYFGTSLLGTQELYGDSLIDVGTDAGGAIEVYTCVEDAEKRNDYLAGFDGGIFASGSHKVLGTMVVRTSDDLKASEQETLTNAIVSAMITIKE